MSGANKNMVCSNICSIYQSLIMGTSNQFGSCMQMIMICSPSQVQLVYAFSLVVIQSQMAITTLIG